MFIPFRPDIKLTRFPAITVAVCVITVLIYIAQVRNESAILSQADAYCDDTVRAQLESSRFQLPALEEGELSCPELLAHAYIWGDKMGHMQRHVDALRAAGREMAADDLQRHYEAFVNAAPPSLTARLVIYAGNWNPLRMLSSSLAHAGWDHLLGNLFFFVSFAILVELILGPVLFLAVFLAMVFGIGLVESLARLGEEAVPSLGLSGVVMGMLALAAYFAPRIKIKFFYWFFVVFGVLGVPIWLLAIWYIGWDLYDQLTRVGDGINYIAHLGGAVVGLGLGLTLFRQKRHWAQTLVVDEPDIPDEDSWFRTFNTLMALPVILVAAAGAFLAVIYVILKFVENFSVQMLLMAPAVAALFQIYRMKKAGRPDYRRYQQAMDLLQGLNYSDALKCLEPLAEEGYPRTQYQLGRLYATGKGVYKDEAAAAGWYEHAASRHYAPAIYALAACYADGRGVSREADKALGLYEIAMRQGLPEAAMSLGYLYEHHPDSNRRDIDKAVEAYACAAQLYLKRGLKEDALAALQSLKAISPGHPRLEALRQLLDPLTL